MTDFGAGFAGDSESSAAESVRSVRPQVCRYKPGFWLRSRFEAELLADITNWPAEIREDVLASIVATVADSTAKPRHSGDCRCAKCVCEALAHNFGFRDSADAPVKEGVPASSLLPRFFWYKHELLKCHGQASIVAEEKPPPSLESDDDDVIEEVEAEEEEAPALLAEDGVDITDEVVKSKRKRVTVIRQAPDGSDLGSAAAAAAPPAAAAFNVNETHTDSFSAAIRDLQFRLNRHGFLADPRTYLGKGRGEEMYDKNDSLFDEDECVPVLESDDSSDASENRSVDDLDDDMEIIYQEGEHLFVMDDESETEEEQVVFASRAANGPRVLVQCNYSRPVNSLCPCPYNPRGWRQPAKRLPEPGMPRILRTFLHTLEHVISHKRTQVLQRGVFDTFEFVSVDPNQPGSLKLNDFGKEQLALIMNLIFQTALMSFLLPYTPLYERDAKSLRFLKPVTRHQPPLSSQEVDLDPRLSVEPSSGGFSEEAQLLPLGQQLASILCELCTRYVSPHLPNDLAYYRNIWIPICEHVMAVAEYRENRWLEDLQAHLDALSPEEGGLTGGDHATGVTDDAHTLIEICRRLLSADSETWLRWLNTIHSHELFTAIDQKKTCLHSMRQDQCDSDLVKVLANELLTSLTSVQRAALVREAEDNPSGLIDALIERDWSDYAAALAAEGLKLWCFRRRHDADRETSPTTPSDGSKNVDDASETKHWQQYNALDVLIPELVALVRKSSYRFPESLRAPSSAQIAKAQLTVLDFFKNYDVNATEAAQGGTKRRRETSGTERAISVPEGERSAREERPAGDASAENVEKKKRTRVLVTDILQTHYTRVIDLLQASPLPLPIPFGVAVQCTKHPVPDQGQLFTSHMMVVQMHKFASVLEIELELLHVDPPLPEECVSELFEVFGQSAAAPDYRRLARISSLSDFLDQVHSCKRLTVEGRTRSLVFAGFDNRTKSFGLLCFPLAYPYVTCRSGPGESVKAIQLSRKIVPSTLRRDDFISYETATVKGRLSLLDFLALQLWLQIYSDLRGSGQNLLLPLVFSNNTGQAEETRVSPALSKALLGGGDIQKEWKAILDRYSFSQLGYLKKWVVHLKRLRLGAEVEAEVTYKSFPAS